MKNRRTNAHKLVQKGVDAPLSPAEQEQLQQYGITDEGKAYRATHAHLTEDLPPHRPEFSLNKRQLKAVATQINKRVQSQRRSRQLVLTVRTMAAATAVLLILFFGLNWWINNNYQPEITAEEMVVPRPTAVPTPALAEGMQYVDLTAVAPEALEQIEPDTYNQTVIQAAANVDYDLFVPSQIQENVSYVGAMVNPDNGAVEIAFRGSAKLLGWYRLWVFSQRPLPAINKNEPLPFMLLPNEAYEIVAINLIESQTFDLNGMAALYQVQQYVTAMGGTSLFVRVAWQDNGRQYTLNISTPAKMNPDTVISAVRAYHLIPFDP
jgi:hypothetical protein